MNARTNIQILKDAEGKPAFAVIPYADYLSLSRQQAPTIPNAVVNEVINKPPPGRPPSGQGRACSYLEAPGVEKWLVPGQGVTSSQPSL